MPISKPLDDAAVVVLLANCKYAKELSDWKIDTFLFGLFVPIPRLPPVIKLLPPVVKGMIGAYVIAALSVLLFITCEDIRIGKTKEELARDMFEVDSLIRTIHVEMDSVAMDFNRLYIDAQRINNGHP